MKYFTIDCDFNGRKYPFNLYIGRPVKVRNPLHYQNLWLNSRRKGIIPLEIMTQFEKIRDIAYEKNVSFEDLMQHVFDAKINKKKTVKLEFDQSLISKKIVELSKIKAPEKKSTIGINEKKPTDSNKSKKNTLKESNIEVTKNETSVDNFMQNSYEETVDYLFYVSWSIWKESNEISYAARSLFIGVGLYCIQIPEKEKTFSQILQEINRQDLDYNLSVILDTIGKMLSPLCFNLIAQSAILSEDFFNHRLIPYMQFSIVDFIFVSKGDDGKKDEFSVIRNHIKKSLLPNSESQLSRG